MAIETIEVKLIAELKKLFGGEASGHDIMHLLRVRNIANHIQKVEGGDRNVIILSALLHDIHRLIQLETGHFCHPKDSLEKAEAILKGLNIEARLISKILHSVEFHEEYDFSIRGKTAADKETQILQDADNLDAIGAIGIARTFSFGGAHNVPIWLPEIPFDRDNFDESKIDPSTIHHFHHKLLRLKENMNTETGKKLALGRHKYMEDFLVQFEREWNGQL